REGQAIPAGEVIVRLAEAARDAGQPIGERSATAAPADGVADVASPSEIDLPAALAEPLAIPGPAAPSGDALADLAARRAQAVRDHLIAQLDELESRIVTGDPDIDGQPRVQLTLALE